MSNFKYDVNKTANPIVVDGDWEKTEWKAIPILNIKNILGTKPKFVPKTFVKVQYNAQFIFVIFKVQDKYVRAVAQEIHGAVWEDSCVEFFFAPSTDHPNHYFNLEVNCGGTPLMSYHRIPRKDYTMLDILDVKKIEIAHSLPKVVEPEITRPVTWIIEYRIPINMLEKYGPVTKPAPGVKWRANFYKCAEKNSNPHWLTWSIIHNNKLDFHQPEFFGELLFN